MKYFNLLALIVGCLLFVSSIVMISLSFRNDVLADAGYVVLNHSLMNAEEPMAIVDVPNVPEIVEVPVIVEVPEVLAKPANVADEHETNTVVADTNKIDTVKQKAVKIDTVNQEAVKIEQTAPKANPVKSGNVGNNKKSKSKSKNKADKRQGDYVPSGLPF